MVDLSQLTLGPCTLVAPDQAAGGQVMQLALQAATPVPDGLQAAALAAGALPVFSAFNLACTCQVSSHLGSV